MAEIRQNWRNTIALRGLTLAGTTAFGIFTARRIAIAIDRVSSASRLLAAGQWSESPIEVSSIAEIDSLARSFNATAEQLRSAFDRVRSSLEASESKFATVFRCCPDPAWIATLAEGRITDANEKLADFCGREQEEIIGKTRVELKLWDDIADLHRFGQTLTEFGRIENFEVVFRDRFGTARTV